MVESPCWLVKVSLLFHQITLHSASQDCPLQIGTFLNKDVVKYTKMYRTMPLSSALRQFFCDAPKSRFTFFITQIANENPGRFSVSSCHSFTTFTSNYSSNPNQLLQYFHRICTIYTTKHLSNSRVIRNSSRMSPVQDTVDSPVVPTQTTSAETSSQTLTKPEVTISTQTAESAKHEAEKMEVENVQSQPKLYFAKLTEHASAPTKGSKFAAGYDLKSAYDAVVPKRGSCLVKTDIQIQLPPGTYGRVAPRSGLALKNKIDVGAGVIDEDYRGNIGVILFNHADEDFVVTKGDRIAQLICEKICYPEAVEVKTLEESERGAAGFGSTGGVKKLKLDEESGNGKTN